MAMTIKSTRYDNAGFPVVEWTEDRNSHAPNSPSWFSSRVTIACFITRDEVTGELLFATNGSPQQGLVYQRRPWKHLAGFHAEAARGLYYTHEELRQHELTRQAFTAMRPKDGNPVVGVLLAGMITDDDSIVMLAEFDHNDRHASVPMHLNYATATQIQVAELHDRLHQAFIVSRDAYVHELCDGEYLWPAGKEHLAIRPPQGATMNSIDRALNRISAMIIIAGMIWGSTEALHGEAKYRFQWSDAGYVYNEMLAGQLSPAASQFIGDVLFGVVAGGIAGLLCTVVLSVVLLAVHRLCTMLFLGE
jgi:hypothetical protein